MWLVTLEMTYFYCSITLRYPAFIKKNGVVAVDVALLFIGTTLGKQAPTSLLMNFLYILELRCKGRSHFQ